jgi:TPR repeat protein
VCGLLLLSANALLYAAQKPSISASIQPAVVQVGQQAVYSVTIEGEGSLEMPRDLQAPDALEFGSPRHSRQVNFNNGVVSKKASLSYPVFPTEPGEFEIPGQIVNVKGQRETTNAVRLIVKPASTGGVAGSAGGNLQQGTGSGQGGVSESSRAGIRLDTLPKIQAIAHAEEDIAALEARAEAGDAKAHAILGIFYSGGSNGRVKILEKRAVFHYQKAAEANDPVGLVNMANRKFHGSAWASKDLDAANDLAARALDPLLKLVNAVSENQYDLYTLDAITMLGWSFYHGLGVEQDYAEAVKWFRHAADQEHADAQFSLGYAYFGGNGVDQDYAEAVKWYRMAAEQGAAAAKNNLGYAYDYGLGVGQDYAEAVKWYRMAADQGYAAAQNNLGYAYYQGNGVDQDYAEAVKWYRMAVEQGAAAAKNNLGYAYDYGLGVGQDYTEAVKWYRMAADQGNAAAQTNLGYAYYQGKGVDQDYAEAVKWFRLAADQGQPLAQRELGYAYDHGRGVDQNYAEAAKWYRKAAEQGDEDAQSALAEVSEKLERLANFDFNAAKREADRQKEKTLVFKNLYVGMPIAAAEGLFRYYFIDDDSFTIQYKGHNQFSGKSEYGHRSFVIVTSDQGQKLDHLHIGSSLVDRLFNVSDMNPEAFAAQFLKSYKLSGLHGFDGGLEAEPGTVSLIKRGWKCSSEQGWRLVITDRKDILLESIPKLTERAFD